MEQIIIGNVYWLRNDYVKDITIGSITYPTLEHAYQAAKFSDRSIKLQIASVTVKEARNIGRKNKQIDDFDRFLIMGILQRTKLHDPELGQKLANTGSAPIVMEGYDEYWGTGSSGLGQNTLGEILQDIRSELQVVYGIEVEDEEDEEESDCDDCDV